MARLIEYGHPDPMHLTPRQAMAYLTAHEGNRRTDLAGLAVAVRVAHHADKQEFGKYMRKATNP